MNYVTKAADQLLTLNPETKMLGPADYLVIAEWEKQEIPLNLVLTSISDGCAALRNENIWIEPLIYINQKVGKDFESWLQETQPAKIGR